jgi:hypothetical protein
MNELAAATSLNLAWGFGALFTVFGVLISVIDRHEQAKHRRHEARLEKLEELSVTNETLDRVERT